MSSFSSSGNQESDSRSAPSHEWIHDVFVSFTKEDTGHDFVSDLFATLRSAGVRVFKDEMEPRSGDQILLQAIEGSMISIVVFSRNYANSSWCLRELRKVMECRRSKGQELVPVFYGVDPSEVLDQTRRFGEALARVDKRQSTNKNKVFSCKKALKEAAAISGFVIPMGFSKESEAIKHIVEHVTTFLYSTQLFIAEYPVGFQSRVQDIIQLLDCYKSDEVLLLGIWGMGGSGKTTIAKALYNQISRNFETSKFLANISTKLEKTDKVSLQEELLSCIQKRPVYNIELGKVILKRSLCCKRVFLVLDDVTELGQLKALCGSHEWFGPGSRIIITTRDKHILNVHRVDHIYTVKIMDYNESVELFSRHAFNNATPERHYDGLTKRVVEACAGLPLALTVMGSHLRGKSLKEAEGALKSLKDHPHKDIMSILKRSFDSLSDTLKKIFLDIASFWVGMDPNDAILILNGSIAAIEISELVDRSLVTVDEENKLRMHDLVQLMGREIICEASQIKPEPRTYDVFLSFRGKDTRTRFTSHLHTSLQNAGFYVFKDDDALPRGEQIELSLLEAIGDSRICVIVLSTNYANSRWCLQELENIMECYRTKTHMVVPIFYGVDPSEVRNQTSKFGQAFEKLIKKIAVKEDKVFSWRTTLRQVGSLSGIVVANSGLYRDESEAIKKIVEDVTRLLDKTELFVAQYPVGVTLRVQEAIKLLKKQQSKDVLLLGICGMGGMGKTTIAKAIYNRIGRNFDGRSFLLNIREVWEEHNGKVSLQERLLYDVFKATKIVIRNIDSGKNELKDRLRQKKVLLVLDDVNKLEQMNALFGSHEWFGSGSCIIITTRNEHLVRVRGVDPIIYRLEEMNEGEAIELFSLLAFKQPSPKEQFVGLSGDVVAYSSGLPLALEVLGSFLCDKEISEWKDVLEKLKKIPHHEIHEKLRISFDGLNDDTEKEIFLDISFFFIGMDRSDVIQILNGCGFHVKIGISVLVERNLVTVDNGNKLGMHHLLRQMGREIIRQKSSKPEKHSRLWIHEEVLDVLNKCKGTKAIKGLALKLPSTNPISLCTKAFKKMKKLRLLQLAAVHPDGDFKYLSTDLRWMNWYGFPLSHTPKDCYQESLVAMELKHSNLKLVWKEAQLLNKLKILNLSHSHHLRETPDFSYLPNLEKLKLKDCPSLTSVSHTVGHLNELLLINLRDCTSLQVLPRSIYKLKSLKTLILSGCTNIDKLEEDLEQMESLTTLKADNTGMMQVPKALARLKSLGYISWNGYEGLARNVMPSIIFRSWTSPRNKPSSLMQPSLGMFLFGASLDVPNVRGKCGSQRIAGDGALDIFSVTSDKELEERRTTSQVSNMDTSALIDRRGAGDVPGSKSYFSSILVQMGISCPVTDILKRSILQKLRNCGPGDCLLPGDKNPHWLTFNGEGSIVTFEVPRVTGRNLKTVMLCIVYSSSPDIVTSEDLILKNVLIINYTKSTTHVYQGDTPISLKDEEWQSIISNLEPGDKVSVIVIYGHGFIVKKTAIYLVYDEPIDQNMEHFFADAFVSGNDTVSGVDDMPTNKNFSVSGGGDEAENKKRYFSGADDGMPANGENDIIFSGDDKNREFTYLWEQAQTQYQTQTQVAEPEADANIPHPPNEEDVWTLVVGSPYKGHMHGIGYYPNSRSSFSATGSATGDDAMREHVHALNQELQQQAHLIQQQQEQLAQLFQQLQEQVARQATVEQELREIRQLKLSMEQQQQEKAKKEKSKFKKMQKKITATVMNFFGTYRPQDPPTPTRRSSPRRNSPQFLRAHHHHLMADNSNGSNDHNAANNVNN